MLHIMQRTTIILPEQIRSRLVGDAERLKISFGELVRNILQKYVVARGSKSLADPFLASTTVFDDNGPRDVSSRHDDYLATEILSRKS